MNKKMSFEQMRKSIKWSSSDLGLTGAISNPPVSAYAPKEVAHTPQGRKTYVTNKIADMLRRNGYEITEK